MRRSWEGEQRCSGQSFPLGRCTRREIEGLGFCFRHVPAEFLEEAEQVTGLRRCRDTALTEHGAGPCLNEAVYGTNPPKCDQHGGKGKTSQVGVRGANQRVESHLSDVLAAHGQEIMDLMAPVDDPLQALLELAAEIRAFKDFMRRRALALDFTAWRYATRAGEHVRGEVIIYERGLDRLAAVLTNIVKLNIESRLARVKEEQVRMILLALDAAFSKAGVPLERQAEARETFVARLRAVA